MKSWELENIEITAKENPETFFIPSKEERDRQKVGDEVRLHFIIKNQQEDEPQAERMWVCITRKKGLFSNYKGVLTNRPLYIKDLVEGDEIEFSSKHIAQTIIRKDSPYWIDSAEQSALVSNKCLEPGGVIRFLYREATDRKEDSGWRMFSGLEDDDYANNEENISIVNIGFLLDKDPMLLVPLKGEVGAVFEREDKDKPWQVVKDWNLDE
ncbi:MAG: immunity protein Imm33 domain-containing protein [Adhaeribacter sp.]